MECARFVIAVPHVRLRSVDANMGFVEHWRLVNFSATDSLAISIQPDTPSSSAFPADRMGRLIHRSRVIRRLRFSGTN